jgi:hypothetical protein
VRARLAHKNAAVVFYTEHLGLKFKHQQPLAFAKVSLGHLICCSAARERQARVACPAAKTSNQAVGTELLRVADLPKYIEWLKKAGLDLRNKTEVRRHGNQVQLDDLEAIQLNCSNQ